MALWTFFPPFLEICPKPQVVYLSIRGFVDIFANILEICKKPHQSLVPRDNCISGNHVHLLSRRAPGSHDGQPQPNLVFSPLRLAHVPRTLKVQHVLRLGVSGAHHEIVAPREQHGLAALIVHLDHVGGDSEGNRGACTGLDRAKALEAYERAHELGGRLGGRDGALARPHEHKHNLIRWA